MEGQTEALDIVRNILVGKYDVSLAEQEEMKHKEIEVEPER